MSAALAMLVFCNYSEHIKNKVDKKEGYDLSKNDFTDELKAKLEASGRQTSRRST